MKDQKKCPFKYPTLMQEKAYANKAASVVARVLDPFILRKTGDIRKRQKTTMASPDVR